MSKLVDIKYRIDQLDGGAFQNLCDAYLACRGYGTGYSLGMKTGTNKTAKGNPDTYFMTADGKYIFVMYTTQKDDFVNKALKDLEKCFDSSKTGLLPENISEIVYCHTSGRLLPGDHHTLHKFCKDQNAVLTLIGLDELGNDLYLNYPRIAKDFLGIGVDTGQIFSANEFVQIHDANKMSAPLHTEFLLREEELKSAKEKLSLSDVLILSGPAGTGKTRLALQLCNEVAKENDYEVICIKSNGLELYDDLSSSIDAGKNYLVFVDDANELTGLHFVLDYLPRAAIGDKHIKKVVITVRDYARQQVANQVLEVEKPEILKVGLFKDDEIRKLIEVAFGITNHVYLDRIVAIAEGNARLAMLAGKVAAETEKITSIQDATELYEHYYGKQLELISNSATGIVSAGIMAFFQALRLDALEKLHPIFDLIGLTENQFISDLNQLHTSELVDLCHDKAAKISDQSFSNYLIKHVFIDKKDIPLNQMIETCFFINKEKTISACNILLNVFSDKGVQEYVEQEIIEVWDRLSSDMDVFFPFFKAFFIVRPTETLVLIKELIDLEVMHPFDVRSITFKKTDSEKSINDDIIGILSGFENHSQLPEAVDLLLRYYKKRPDLFEEICSAFISKFGVDKESLHLGYYTQKIVVKHLCEALETDQSDALLILFVRVAEEFLKFSFSRTEGGRKNTFTFYTMPLTLHESVLEYRQLLWKQIHRIYQFEKCHQEIESLLMDYCKRCDTTDGCEIVNHELESILGFFSQFSPENLYHCVIAEHIQKVAERVQYGSKDILIPFLSSRKYQIYNILNADRTEMLHLGHREYDEYHRAQVTVFMQEYGLDEFQHLFQVCKECIETVDPKAQKLSYGVECAIGACAPNNELFVAVVNAYLDADTPYNVRAYGIIQSLLRIMTADEVKRMIDKHDFSQKSTWLWDFYVELPTDQITSAWADNFLLYLENVPQHLQSAPYRPLDEMEKFECVDKDIILKASRIALSHFEESPFVFDLYFSLMMNPYRVEASKIIAKYKSDISLLENIYLKCTTYSAHNDHDGQFLSGILESDPSFLDRYLDMLLAENRRLYGSRDEWTSRLEFIWKDNLFENRMDRISDYVYANSEGRRWDYGSIIGYLLLHKSGEIDVAEKQEKWIQHTIELHSTDPNRMYALFAAIEEHSETRRQKALETLLRLNNDYTLFEVLPLEASSWGGSGSMIPHMQKRITYLESLKPLLTGIERLPHRQKVEHDIEIWKNRIKSEEISELLDSLG